MIIVATLCFIGMILSAILVWYSNNDLKKPWACAALASAMATVLALGSVK